MKRFPFALALLLFALILAGCRSASSPASATPNVAATQPDQAQPAETTTPSSVPAEATTVPGAGGTSGGALAATPEASAAAPAGGAQPAPTTAVPAAAPAEPTGTPNRPAPTLVPLPPSPTPVPLRPLPTTPPPAVAPAQPTPTPLPISAPLRPAAAVPTGVGLQLMADGLTSPVALVPAPDDSGRLFVVDQTGVIRIIGRDGKLSAQPFLDVRDRMVRLSTNYDERGLLGLAFHPDFANNRKFYVYYVAPLRQGGPAGWDSTSHLSEFTISAGNPDVADPGSERVVMQIDEPQANHKGGAVAFGPDGYLYLSLGDGGGGNDVGMGHAPDLGNAQDLSKPLGKILRIDVNGRDHGQYGIPADNPFAGGPVPEIYAYGLRNPYRLSFDMGGDHALYTADAGQNLFEEVDIVTKGGNYGWHIREGSHCFDPGNPSSPPASCPNTGARGEPLVGPIVEYSHQEVGLVDVGGFVYRGQAIPGLVGQYIFGDWSTGYSPPNGTLLVGIRPGGQGSWQLQKLQITTGPGGKIGHFVLGFGQDRAGEIYVLTSDTPGPAGNTGKVYKMVPGQ